MHSKKRSLLHASSTTLTQPLEFCHHPQKSFHLDVPTSETSKSHLVLNLDCMIDVPKLHTRMTFSMPWTTCRQALLCNRQTPHITICHLFQIAQQFFLAFHNKQQQQCNLQVKIQHELTPFWPRKLVAMIFQPDAEVLNYFVIGEWSKFHHLSQYHSWENHLIVWNIQEIPIPQPLDFVYGLQSAFLDPNTQSFQ